MYERFNNYSSDRPRLRKSAGWFLVVVGFVALIMPVVPGAPLVFVGLELLGLRIIFTDKIKNLFRRGGGNAG
jgi:hypothetical protein